MLQKAQASGMFFYVDTDLKIDKPQTTVNVDRDLVATLGLTQQDVGAALGAALGGGYVNYFSIAGRSYKVIPQVLQVGPAESRPGARLLPSHAGRIAHPRVDRRQAEDRGRARGDRALPAAQLRDDLRRLLARRLAGPGASLHAAGAAGLAPSGYTADYSGVSRQFVQESGGFAMTLLFAIIIVFLALAAQFESFRDPIVILVSVPMALFGALIFINLGVGYARISTRRWDW